MGDGAVTYQGLERLTHMPDRTGNQGDAIAAQKYYDVYITGGEITGVSFSPTMLTVNDNGFFIQDNLDNTKKAQFQASGITTGTTRIFTFPDADTTLAGTDATQTLTNKTLSGNTISSTLTANTGGAILIDDSVTGVGGVLPLTFDGDTDTGFFRSAANIFNAAAGGVSIARFQQGTATGMRMDRAIYFVNGSNIASATTTDLGAATGNTVLITGTTTITSFGTTPPVGSRFTTRFQGVLTLTNSANLICIGGTNITTAANDVAEWIYEAASTWRMLSYTRADGSVAGIVSGAQGGTGVNNSGKTITLGGNLTTSGAFSATLTLTNTTTVTLPTTGTLATLAGAEALTNKSVNGVTLTTGGATTNFLNASGTYTALGMGWVPIKTVTASGNTSIDFVNGSAGVVLDSTYKHYCVVFSSVKPATDNVSMYFRTSTNGGVSYDSGASDYQYAGAGRDSSTGAINVSSAGAAFIEMISGMGNDTGETISGRIFIATPSNATYCNVDWFAGGQSTLVNSRSIYGQGFRQANADVDAIRFLMSSGNITSGTFTLYGLRDAP